MPAAAASLTEAVAHLAPNATWETVQSTLTPHLPLLLSSSSSMGPPSCTSRTPTSTEEEEECWQTRLASALWLACDRGHEPAVRFLLGQATSAADSRCRGDGFTSCSTTTSQESILRLVALPHAASGNTAAHYAAHSLPVFQLLQEYCCYHCTDKNDENDDDEDNYLYLRELYNTRNHHGDTPLMMACVSGSVELVRYMLSWLSLSSTSCTHHPQNRKSVVNARNRSNDSALSLACGHGHVEIVQMLLLFGEGHYGAAPASHPTKLQLRAEIQDDDWQRAQASLHQMNQAVQKLEHQQQEQQLQQSDAPRLPNADQLAQWHEKQLDLQCCVTLVRDELQRRSDAAALELLSTLTVSQKGTDATAKVVQNNKSQRRAKPKRQKPKDNEKLKDTAVDFTKNATTDKSSSTKEDTVILTQLQDGTRAVAVVGVDEEFDDPDDTKLARPTISRPHPDDLSSSSSLWRTTLDDVAQDMMRALCLDDASLLLQTSHGLALHCSPAQLDGIETVLQRQLQAVQQARTIQQRVRACRTTTTMTSGNHNTAAGNLQLQE